MEKTAEANAGEAQQDQYQQLEERSARLQTQVDQLEAKVKWYEEQIRLGKQKQYGASSEKTPPEQLQFADLLVNDGEMEADLKREEPTVETNTYQRRKTVGQREAKLQDLPVEISRLTLILRRVYRGYQRRDPGIVTLGVSPGKPYRYKTSAELDNAIASSSSMEIN